MIFVYAFTAAKAKYPNEIKNTETVDLADNLRVDITTTRHGHSDQFFQVLGSNTYAKKPPEKVATCQQIFSMLN